MERERQPDLAQACHAQPGRQSLFSPVAARLAESLRYQPLTVRELTVLSYVVRGRSDKGIGSRGATPSSTAEQQLAAVNGSIRPA
jgi:DNA-binding NarL/FixJ family response regulator